MEKKKLFVALMTSLLFCTLLSMPAFAQAKKSLPEIAEIGSFFVGGGEVTVDVTEDQIPKDQIDSTGNLYNPNGTYESGQMYVQYVRLKRTKAKYPLMMWHGGGLTGATYETTPDGRPGWRDFFLRAGHDVYLSDSVERGRSGFSLYPFIFTTPPQTRNKAEMWVLFRIGAEYRKPFAGTQFPVEAFDAFVKQGVPRWTSTDSLIYAAYLAYLDKMSTPAVVIAHSQGCKFAMQAAIDRPQKVKGVVLLEPYTPLDGKKFDVSAMKDTPLLVLYGDYVDKSPSWTKWSQGIRETLTDPLEKAGGNVTWVDLPKVGIKGNGHEMYLEKNSDEVAQLVQNWMTKQKLMK